jgi:hypothetical protein
VIWSNAQIDRAASGAMPGTTASAVVVVAQRAQIVVSGVAAQVTGTSMLVSVSVCWSAPAVGEPQADARLHVAGVVGEIRRDA